MQDQPLLNLETLPQDVQGYLSIEFHNRQDPPYTTCHAIISNTN